MPATKRWSMGTAAPLETPTPQSLRPMKPLPVSTPTPTPEPTEEPTPTPQPKTLEGIVIGIDPGHQAKANSAQEPVAPGSDETKDMVSTGAAGVETGTAEHVINLAVAMELKDLLESAGAYVIMTRQSADVDISNIARAQAFNEAGVILGIRLHCNGEDDKELTGAFMLAPEENPYEEICLAAAEEILAVYCEETGLENKGVSVRDDQTGFNWCTRPVINLEMGHLSNAEEEKKLVDPDFQEVMARGIFDGVQKFFEVVVENAGQE